MIENKKIMADNIRRHMEMKNVTATDICKTLHIKQNTFSDWINAKTYPRIDKIEMLSNYFGVPKSALVEEQPIVIMGSSDNVNRLLAYAEKLGKLSPEARDRILHYIDYETQKECNDHES